MSDYEQEAPCEGRPSRAALSLPIVLWEDRAEIPLSDPITGNSKGNPDSKNYCYKF
jgi:hypothetical protein